MKRLIIILFVVLLTGCVSKHIKYHESFKRMNALEHRMLKRDLNTIRNDFYENKKSRFSELEFQKIQALLHEFCTGNLSIDVQKIKTIMECDLEEAYKIYKKIKGY